MGLRGFPRESALQKTALIDTRIRRFPPSAPLTAYFSQSVLSEYMGVDWEVAEFAELLFGDYLTQDDKVEEAILGAPVSVSVSINVSAHHVYPEPVRRLEVSSMQYS